MYVFPSIPSYDEYTIWRVHEGEPIYVRCLAQNNLREFIRQSEEQRMRDELQQEIREMSHAFGETTVSNDVIEDGISTLSRDCIMSIITSQLKCDLTPEHVVRALYRAIQKYHIDTRDIVVNESENLFIINIVLQSSSIARAVQQESSPATVDKLVELILFRNDAIIDSTLASQPSTPTIAIDYGTVLYTVAVYSIHLDRIMRAVNLCMQYNVQYPHVALAQGLAQNIVVCDILLALHDSVPHDFWMHTLFAILQVYCFGWYAYGAKNNIAGGACLFARDMIRVKAKTTRANIMNIIKRAFDIIVPIMGELQQHDPKNDAPFCTRLTLALGEAITLVICHEHEHK